MHRQRPTTSAITRLRAAAALAAILTGLLALSAGAGTAAAQTDARTVLVTEVRGAITPVIADHLADAVDAASARGAAALVVELDTPGGLVSSMRVIVQGFLNAPVPVVVYVTPSGADAGSAGTYITLAANIAAMAPATTIGAATPVDLEGGEVGDKIVNNAAAFAETIAEQRGRDVEFAVDAVRDGRSITATEALEVGAIDLIADSLDDLLGEIDGRTVTVAGGGEVTLATGGAIQERFDLSATRGILQRIADPNLAFLFISIGTLAIVYEFANPGVGAGGVVGAIMIILAMFSLSVLPVNLAGVALLLVGAALFVIEVFAPGIGVGAAGGTVALVLGGLFLFQRPSGLGVDLAVLVPTAVVGAAVTVVVGRVAARTRHLPSRAASDHLIGRTATLHDLDREHDHPRVRLDGTWWRARPAPGSDLAEGDRVTVTGRDNLELLVARPQHLDPQHLDPHEPRPESSP